MRYAFHSQVAGHTAREERRLSIPQLEVSFRNIPTGFRLGASFNAKPLKRHTFGRFSVRGPAAWRVISDGGTGRKCITTTCPCKALLKPLWRIFQGHKHAPSRSFPLFRFGVSYSPTLH